MKKKFVYKKKILIKYSKNIKIIIQLKFFGKNNLI